MCHALMKPMLSRLSVINWLVLCLVLSVLGSVTASLGFAVLDGIDFANPYFLPATLEELFYLVGYSLLVNFLGAAALILFFAIRERLRAR